MLPPDSVPILGGSRRLSKSRNASATAWPQAAVSCSSTAYTASTKAFISWKASADFVQHQLVQRLEQADERGRGIAAPVRVVELVEEAAQALGIFGARRSRKEPHGPSVITD